MLFFAPSEPAEGFPRRPGTADFNEDGEFEASSFKTGDGLLPGKYVVNVECWEVPPSMGAGPPAKTAVPGRPRKRRGLRTHDRGARRILADPRPRVRHPHFRVIGGESNASYRFAPESRIRSTAAVSRSTTSG